LSTSGKPPEGGTSGKRPERPGLSAALRDAAPYLALGSTLAASVLLGLAAGYWLDSKLGTRPAFFLAGAVLGLLAAGLHFYRTLVIRKR
jgi:F0F1-type ATP synthase assembly protein I